LLELKVHPEAATELIQAWEWYNNKKQGLGDEFFNEVERAIKMILKTPKSWPVYVHDTRRYLLRRFPYAVVYRQKDEEILIVAIMHLRRKPDYWMRRI